MQRNNTNTVEGVLRQLTRYLSETRGCQETERQFAAFGSNRDRVDAALGLLKEFKLLPVKVVVEKSDEESTRLRLKGNEKFKVKKDEEALEFYTKCICFAREGECLALGYANRSAVLFEKGLYFECLQDIVRALDNSYPERLKEKLLSRRAKAADLVRTQKPRQYYQPAPTIPPENQNKCIQSASASVSIRNSKEFGRYVVAEKDIKVGEVIAVETPFCQILLEEQYFHCHHCLKLCYNLIPCEKCTQILYCSKECKEKAFNNYHKYECPILDTVRDLNIDMLKILYLRLALIVKDQYDKIGDFKNEETSSYCSDRYKEIYELVPNTELRSGADLFERAVTAALLFYLTESFTTFFEGAPESYKMTFKELLLLHMQSGACNFHDISEMRESQMKIYEGEQIGSGAYSFLSMINHSCIPNVTRFCYGTSLVVRALRNIKKGEQIYDNYGPHFAINRRPERREKLKRQYFFECVCEACTNDIALYFNLPMFPNYPGISPTGLGKLEKGNLDAAKKILKKCLPKLEELGKKKPSKNRTEYEEIVKQCYSIFTNMRRPL